MTVAGIHWIFLWCRFLFLLRIWTRIFIHFGILRFVRDGLSCHLLLIAILYRCIFFSVSFLICRNSYMIVCSRFLIGIYT